MAPLKEVINSGDISGDVIHELPICVSDPTFRGQGQSSSKEGIDEGGATCNTQAHAPPEPLVLADRGTDR